MTEKEKYLLFLRRLIKRFDAKYPGDYAKWIREGQQKGADVTKGLGPKKTTSLSKKRATSITAKKVGGKSNGGGTFGKTGGGF